MKNTKVCPKCSGDRIVVNERVGFRQKMYKGQDPFIAPLPVLVRKTSVPGLLFGSSEDVEEIGTFKSFTCGGCGYTELYAVNPGALL